MKIKLAIVALNAAGAAGVSVSFPAGGMRRVLEEDCITEEELAMEELAEEMSLSMSYPLETGEDAGFGRKKRNLRGVDVRRRKTRVLCSETLPPTTASPSVTPSMSPTTQPTTSPTSSPSGSPTTSPTTSQSPTESPTTEPTASPSTSPTLSKLSQDRLKVTGELVELAEELEILMKKMKQAEKDAKEAGDGEIPEELVAECEETQKAQKKLLKTAEKLGLDVEEMEYPEGAPKNSGKLLGKKIKCN